MNSEEKTRYDRFTLDVSDDNKRKSRFSIDIPTYFPIDTSALWKVVVKEMIKQEKRFEKDQRGQG